MLYIFALVVIFANIFVCAPLTTEPGREAWAFFFFPDKVVPEKGRVLEIEPKQGAPKEYEFYQFKNFNVRHRKCDKLVFLLDERTIESPRQF